MAIIQIKTGNAYKTENVPLNNETMITMAEIRRISSQHHGADEIIVFFEDHFKHRGYYCPKTDRLDIYDFSRDQTPIWTNAHVVY